jgi:tetratricopeptide (TPR) repeat protein
MAGLTFLSGCSGAASDPIAAAKVSSRPQSASNMESAATKSLAPRHTLDGAVRPVWYEFADPPIPGLHAADGHAIDEQAFGEESVDASPVVEHQQHEPIVVRPSGDSAVERLPPVDSEATELSLPRYDVPSRYSASDAESNEAPSVFATECAAPAQGFKRLPPPPGAASDANLSRDVTPSAVRRLPPVEQAPPVEVAPSYAPRMDDVPTQTVVAPRARSNAIHTRPSDVFADEARPIRRLEAPRAADEFRNHAPARSNASPIVTPDYEPQSSPIVLPPASADSVLDRSPSASVHPPRHREMQLINDRAGEGVRRGFELAHRGALYSAQAEFAAALRTIAQALDAQENSTRHAESLSAGLAALDESEDFLASARSSAATVDVATIVVKHRTPVLKDAPKEDLTPITALQRYYTFAQEQLAAAVENEPAASQALYGMGKVQTTLQSTRTATVADGPKAIALHQAALIVDNRNFMAANELGVLMARCGRYDAARAALAHSVSIAPQPAVWRNLAAVHDQLGETTLAANARAAASNTAPTTTIYDGSPAMPQKPVMWLDPGAFAQSAQPQSDLQRGQPAATSATATPNPVPHTSEKKSGMKWPLW